MKTVDYAAGMFVRSFLGDGATTFRVYKTSSGIVVARLLHHTPCNGRENCACLPLRTSDIIPQPSREDAERVEKILELARKIGAHWRDQEGVNDVLIDELAALTEVST